MAAYSLEFTAGAARQFRKLAKPVQERLEPHITALAGTPRPAGAKKLKGADGYRIRVGDYRVLYEIRDEARVVLVVGLGHRREVYR